MASEKKYVLITGVSTGIGNDAVGYLIKNGYHVFGSVRKEDDVTRLVAEQSAGPVAHAEEYQRFKDLISHQAETDVETYLLEGHSFEEFAGEVSRYNKLIEEISYNCQKVPFSLYFLCLIFDVTLNCTSVCMIIKDYCVISISKVHQIAQDLES